MRRVRFIVRWVMAWGWAPQRDWWGAWDRGLHKAGSLEGRTRGGLCGLAGLGVCVDGAGGLPRSMLCGGARRTGQTLHRHAVRQATGKATTLSLLVTSKFMIEHVFDV